MNRPFFIFHGFFFLATLWLAVPGKTFGQTMNHQDLKEVLEQSTDQIQGERGKWKINYKGITIWCVTDTVHNRVQLVSPIKDVSELTDKQIKRSLEANFDDMLDVRYAISNGLMWVGFFHPFDKLQPDLATDAIKQVYTAVETFGMDYRSTDIYLPEK